jgi:hypothetical protein
MLANGRRPVPTGLVCEGVQASGEGKRAGESVGGSREADLQTVASWWLPEWEGRRFGAQTSDQDAGRGLSASSTQTVHPGVRTQAGGWLSQESGHQGPQTPPTRLRARNDRPIRSLQSANTSPGSLPA